MQRWFPMNYKPSCSKWCDPCDRIYGKYEIYDPYMGKGDGKRRGRQSMSTIKDGRHNGNEYNKRW
jgi:hypothetical protein